MNAGLQPSALFIADHPGHILERLALGWAQYGVGVRGVVQNSLGVSNYRLCRLGAQHDVIHWVDQLRFIYCAAAAARPQVVMVHHLTDDMQTALLGKARYCDAVTTASVAWRDRLTALVDVPVYLLPYTIDTTWFTPAPQALRAEMRAAAGLQPDQFVIGYVGKAKADHQGRKGLDVLLAVLRQAATCWSNLAVVLVGPGWETLKASLEALGLRVLHYEFATSNETRQAYRLMDALLVTSRVEGGPVTILEAMACGVAVVTSAVGHVPEVVEDGVNGFIAPQRTVEEYIAALGRLRADAHLRCAIIENGRAWVVRERDDARAIPHYDLRAIYAEAGRRYNARSAAEKARRYVGQGNLWLRQQGGRLRHLRPQRQVR